MKKGIRDGNKVGFNCVSTYFLIYKKQKLQMLTFVQCEFSHICLLLFELFYEFENFHNEDCEYRQICTIGLHNRSKFK